MPSHVTYLRQPLRWRLATALPHGERWTAHSWRTVTSVVLALVLVLAMGLAALAWSLGLGAQHAALEGLLILAGGMGALLPVWSRRLRSASASLALVAAAATLTHLTAGVPLGHVAFAAALAVAALYRDWLPFLASALATVGYHVVVGGIDPHSVVGHGGGDPMLLALLHGAFALALGAALYVRPARYRFTARRLDVAYG